MRRLAALFSSNQDSKRHLNIITPPRDSHPHSSGSSTGSASLRTPDAPDDDPVRMRHKKSWISWLAPKKSPTVIHNPATDNWTHLKPPTEPDVTSDDSADDYDDYDDSLSIHPPATVAATPPGSLSKSRSNLRISLSNKLAPRLSSPPLYHILRAPSFPRSVNPVYASRRPLCLRSQMHMSHLLRRLEHDPLSPPEELSIMPFGTRPTPPETRTKLPSIDEEAVDDKCLTSTSPGLRRWTSRPCFEDRFVVWLPAQDDSTELVTRVVSSAGFAVAELEYSESLETMAGLNDSESAQREPPALPELAVSAPREERSEPSSSTSSTSSLPERRQPYKAPPSALRIQHELPSVQVSTTPSPKAPSPSAPAPPPTATKRGVRFVEDSKEDQVPLAYVLRIKKNKEEKAKFLREEQERRAWDEERKKHEFERLEREKERREWEREKKAWEKERKAIEEERKAKLYAEEVAAARQRRETSRAGPNATLFTSSSQLSAREPDNRSVREPPQRYSRPVYDIPQNSRRQASETTPGHSSGSSGSPSIAGASQSDANHTARHSRPASMYSAQTYSSADDIRSREASGSQSSKFNSLRASHKPIADRSSTYPSAFNFIPPVTPTPPFALLDVPLLPPTPPFMMQQYPRPRSNTSPRNSVQKPSRSGSSERANHPPPSPQQRQQRPLQPQHTGRDPQPPRRQSTYTTPASESGRTARSSSYPQLPSQPSSLSRGRSYNPPSSSSAQSPWTALPTTAQMQGGMTTAPPVMMAPKMPGRSPHNKTRAPALT